MKLKAWKEVLSEAASGWSDHQDSSYAAALAYYTLFAIAPLLIISITISGFFFGKDASQGHIVQSLQSLVGKNGAQAIQSMLAAAADKPKTGLWASIASLVTLLLGASGAFTQLQTSLNVIWGVRVVPGKGWKVLIRQRFLSFAMILVISFLLLVSLLISAVLSAAGNFLSASLPGGTALWGIVNLTISFGVTTLLFAAIYKILPDVNLRWRDVWTSAGITALLFTIGKHFIGLYLGTSSVASAYGAAGSLIIVLLWVNYSSFVLLFGAELSRALLLHARHSVAPKKDALVSFPKSAA